MALCKPLINSSHKHTFPLFCVKAKPCNEFKVTHGSFQRKNFQVVFTFRRESDLLFWWNRWLLCFCNDLRTFVSQLEAVRCKCKKMRTRWIAVLANDLGDRASPNPASLVFGFVIMFPNSLQFIFSGRLPNHKRNKTTIITVKNSTLVTFSYTQTHTNNSEKSVLSWEVRVPTHWIQLFTQPCYETHFASHHRLL